MTVSAIADTMQATTFGIVGEPMRISARVIDPGNRDYKPARQTNTSLLHIPGNPPLLHDFQDVPHGAVTTHEYMSKSLNRLRRVRVYTPPGYGRDAAKKYPALYLFHGSGDNEGCWSDSGKAHHILDNLIADKKADAFFTCGSSRLLKLMQKLGKKHGIPGQVAMEQIMVCGFGACYVCMRTFEIDGVKTS
mgnify:CR=1 FL=1